MSETFDFGDGPVPAHRHVNGEGWVADTAEVSKMAQVSENARVYDRAIVRHGAAVLGSAKVYGQALIADQATVYEDAQVFGKARICYSSIIGGHAQVYDQAYVADHANICDKIKVAGEARISGDVHLYGDFTVHRTPIAIDGTRWKILLVGNHIRIGCQQHTIAEWQSFTDEQIEYMRRGASHWWKLNRSWILEAARTHLSDCEDHFC